MRLGRVRDQCGHRAGLGHPRWRRGDGLQREYGDRQAWLSFSEFAKGSAEVNMADFDVTEKNVDVNCPGNLSVGQSGTATASMFATVTNQLLTESRTGFFGLAIDDTD